MPDAERIEPGCRDVWIDNGKPKPIRSKANADSPRQQIPNTTSDRPERRKNLGSSELVN